MAGYIPPAGWTPKGDAGRLVHDGVRFVVDVEKSATGIAVSWGTHNGDVTVGGNPVKVTTLAGNASFKKDNDGTLHLTVQVRVTRKPDGTVSIVTPGGDPVGP